MQKNLENNTHTQYILKNWHIIATLGLIAVIGGIIAFIYRNQINPDGVSYIQNAYYYSQFNFKAAISGYWSPLLSWILVPAIWLHIDAQYAYRILIVLFSLGIISVLLYISNYKQKVSFSQKITQFLLLSTIGITLAGWGSMLITPDVLSGIVLSLSLVLGYLTIKNPYILKFAVLFGLSLALLYFTRSIGLYLSIAILLTFFAGYAIQKRSSYKNLVIAACIFAGLSTIWIGLISLKYDTFTISTSSDYNAALYGPQRPIHPQLRTGYLETPYPESVWAWDDPSFFSLPSWEITENIWYFKYHFINTLSASLNLLFTITPLFAISVIVLSSQRKDREIAIILGTLALVTILIILAYSVILYIEPRYLWFPLIPIILFGAAQASKKTSGLPLIFILLITFLSTLVTTASLYQSSHKAQHAESAIKELSQSSSHQTSRKATIAAPYPHNFQFCYYSNTRCVGNYELTGNYAKDKSTLQEMKSKDIQYYVEFSKKRINYLKPIHHSRAKDVTCFFESTGKSMPCDNIHIYIYLISDSKATR